MSRSLKLALVQQRATADVDANRAKGEEAFVRAVDDGADLVVFPELAFSPFYPQQPAEGDVVSFAEPIPGPTTERFQALAAKHGAACVLNLYERDSRSAFDASPVIGSDGELLGVVRMVHILEAPKMHEQGYYNPGDNRDLVFDIGPCKIGVAICYDRHFPEYMRALSLAGAELVCVPQAGAKGEWPSGLFEAELQIAGFQNGYFTALCNRVGSEHHVEFGGGSFVTAPDGQVLDRAPQDEECVLCVDLELDLVETSAARRHFLKDRRPALYGPWLTGERG